MPDAPLLPNHPTLQGGGAFPTQGRIADGSELMAHVQVLEDTGDVLFWLGDSMITASKILLSYMDFHELQSFILSHSVGQLGYSTDAPNLFSADGLAFSSENASWIEDVIAGTPVQFIKQANAAPTSTIKPTVPSGIQRPDIPVFTPSSVPSFSRRTS